MPRTRVVEDEPRSDCEARIAELEAALGEEREKSKQLADAYDAATDYNGNPREPSKGAYILGMILAMALHVWIADSKYYGNFHFMTKIIFIGVMFMLFAKWADAKKHEWRIAFVFEGTFVLLGAILPLIIYYDDGPVSRVPHGREAWVLAGFCSILMIVGQSSIFQLMVNAIKRFAGNPIESLNKFFGNKEDE